MSNKILSGFSIANFIVLIGLICFIFLKKEKVVYVDSPTLINNYKGMAVARQEYKVKATKWKANVDTLAKEFQMEVDKYKRESLGMSDKEKDLSKKLLQTKQQQFEDYQKAINAQAGQEDAASTKKVVAEINAFIKEYGEKKGYTIIFAATEYGNIAYAKNNLDVTAEVLEGLNKKYSGKE